MAQKDWMASYQNRKLGEIHLPGSHDAGTTRHYIDKTVFGTDSNAATQDLTIPEQLMAGTRFFDLRLATHNKKVVAHHTTAGQGAYSKTAVDDVLAAAAAAAFCAANRTEVAIFRISHTSLSTNRGISTCGCHTGTHVLHRVICNGLKGQSEHNEKHGQRHEHLWRVYWQKSYTNPVSRCRR